MDIEKYIDKVIPFIKKWGFSLLLLIPVWILIEQHWLTLRVNVMFAVNYPYPPILGFFFFLLDNVDLIMHEAGHTFMRFFGNGFLTSLGGSLWAILIPFFLFLTAWKKEQRILAQSSLFWCGYSWFVSAGYCADAYHKQLPLIGNDPSKSGHDYANMLSDFNILDKYMEIAWVIFSIGVCVLLLSLIWPIFENEDLETIDLSKELKKSGLR